MVKETVRGLAFNCPIVVKGYWLLVSVDTPLLRWSICSCMYCRKFRLDHWPKFVMSVSLFTNSLIAITTPYWRKCVSTIWSIMPCFPIPRARMDTFTVLLICRRFIPDFCGLCRPPLWCHRFSHHCSVYDGLVPPALWRGWVSRWWVPLGEWAGPVAHFSDTWCLL